MGSNETHLRPGFPRFQHLWKSLAHRASTRVHMRELKKYFAGSREEAVFAYAQEELIRIIDKHGFLVGPAKGPPKGVAEPPPKTGTGIMLEHDAHRHSKALKQAWAEQEHLRRMNNVEAQRQAQQYAQNMGMFGQAQAGNLQQQLSGGSGPWTDYRTTTTFLDPTYTTSVAVKREAVPPPPSCTPNQDWLDQRINEIRIAL